MKTEKLTPTIIKEWEMYNGEDFYVDGPLSREITKKMIEPFVDMLFEKIPNLVYSKREDIESIYDLEFEEEAQTSEENFIKIGAIFCEVADNLGVSNEIFETIKADFTEELAEAIEEGENNTIDYMQEDAPTIYEIVRARVK